MANMERADAAIASNVETSGLPIPAVVAVDMPLTVVVPI